ncbi:flagellar filament capping protein FliD [Thalassomonas haliotis]|uniref:Flagellar hook-associated protein 2 n=1 Tax=Thalassomonas haliotis TaxID=485448 RepID=A0ABY7VEW4_9GAMM|nr:flagellar filament capping protein FliD [Thalassomonas haliotis]WDE12103.1 flagellar filament capping protein FliD [Thalassomonas haliotis]
MIDAASFASQLVSAERSGLDRQYQIQQTLAQNKITAYQSLDTKVSAFDSILTTLADSKNLNATTTSLSQDGYFTASTSDGATAASYTVEVSKLAQAHRVGLDFASETWVAPTGGNLNIDLAGTSMDLDLSTLPAGATLVELRDAINSAADNPGVQAAIIRTGSNVKLVLNSEQTGAANTINMALSGGSGTEYTELDTAITGSTQLTAAQDAEFKFSGIDIVSSTNKVADVVDNLTLELTQTNAGNPVTLTVNRDDDSISNNLQSLVDAYNGIIDEIKGTTLSDDDSYVALSGDATARTLSSQLRNAFFDLPSGTYLSDLGLEFDRYGKLSLDSSELSDALDADPTILDTMLLASDGLVTQLAEKIEPYSKSSGIFDDKVSTLNDEIERINNKTEQLNLRMENTYQRYLMQFTRMNELESQMQATSSLFSISTTS